jgi:5-hydroxyisourate hydrolase
VITTHVLDLAAGRPAAGVPVALERKTGDDTWTTLARTKTDDDGRARDLAAPPARGRYRLVFDAPSAFFPEVAIQFVVDDPAEHLHVPLLLSPYGYSTYRGS